MDDSLFSPHWYRVASLHPRLISHANVSRQSFRGEQWHIITSRNSGRQFRLNHVGYQFVGRLDGRRSVQQIWDALLRQLANDAPSQTEILNILSELNAAGLIHTEQSADLGQIFDASARRAASKRPSLMSIKVPLFEPTRLLDALLPATAWMFRRSVFILWAFSVLAAIVAIAIHWRELTNYAQVYALAPASLIAAWFCYPVIKALHELAHGLAIRYWGGEVHEMGVTLFLLVPIPYVDASSASAFPEKHRRIAVSAMGIVIETAVAAVALTIWLSASDGLLRQVAFSCLLIGGLSTILVNANPLMRYDGYYILADAIEVPSLAARADAWMRYVGERFLLGNPRAKIPPDAGCHPALLLSYGVASWLWRISLFIAITAWLAAQHIIAGLLLGTWMTIKMIVWPLVKLSQFVFSAPRLAACRGRALMAYTCLLIVPIMALFTVPVTNTTLAQGIVWSPDSGQVRSGSDGFIGAILARSNSQVSAGQAILEIDNPELIAARDQLRARISSLEIRYQAALMHQPAQAQALMQAKLRSDEELAELEIRIDSLRLVSPHDGLLILPNETDLLGRFVPRGALLAHVISPNEMIVRAVLNQNDVSLLSAQDDAIAVRLGDALGEVVSATVASQTPAASWKLPSPVLSEAAGGPVATDPADQEGLRSLKSFFLADFKIESARQSPLGTRAWLRIEHSKQALGMQWLRRLQQAFLRQIDAPTGQSLGVDLIAPAIIPAR